MNYHRRKPPLRRAHTPFTPYRSSQQAVLGLSLLLLFFLAACAPALPASNAPEHRQNLPLQQGGLAETAPAPSSPLATPMPEVKANKANADVEFVRAQQHAGGAWTFSVTVRHPDTGWEDYADGWDVVLPDGTVIKPDPNSPFTRLLLHPHVDEQPFTRSQSNIIIPDGVTTVTVRAHDLVDGWGGKVVTVDLTQAAGPGFAVESALTQ